MAIGSLKQNITKRTRFNQLKIQLDAERSTFETQWQEISDFVLPRRLILNTDEVNEGKRKDSFIIDSTPTSAIGTLSSGMMAGVTSPARPWFKLATDNDEMNKIEAVKVYLTEVQKRMNNIFIKSNLYNILPTSYKDLGGFGTSAIFMDEDDEETVRFYSLPLGSYWIATDHKNKINTFIREYDMTVGQVVTQFGKRRDGSIDWENISESVQNLYDQDNLSAWVTVCQVIEENPDFDEEKFEPKFKKFSSSYFEVGINSESGMQSSDSKGFLRESGYDFFPVLVPRWEVAGGDIYATDCPGMNALGDIKQLQKGEEKTLLAIDKMIDPPMKGPTTLKNASILPGDITYEDDVSLAKGGFRPVHEINFRVDLMENKQAQVRDRIKKVFFVDLFLMLANSDRRQITATEINERKEEKLLALGPVLEQLNQDLLDPLIDNTFNIMEKQGLLPEPPEELQGVNLNIQYVSIMAQAQKLIGLGSIERVTNYIAGVAGFDPKILDKFNSDGAADLMADTLGLDPGIIRSAEEVEEIREAKRQAIAAEQQQQQLQAAASTAKQLSETDISGDNALTAITEGLSQQ